MVKSDLNKKSSMSKDKVIGNLDEQFRETPIEDIGCRHKVTMLTDLNVDILAKKKKNC